MIEFVPNDKQSQFLESDDDVCMIAGGAGSSYVKNVGNNLDVLKGFSNPLTAEEVKPEEK